jgi:hypothetical protein
MDLQQVLKQVNCDVSMLMDQDGWCLKNSRTESAIAIVNNIDEMSIDEMRCGLGLGNKLGNRDQCS